MTARPSDAELLARWEEAYRTWLEWYHDGTPGKGWGVGQDAAFHMGRVAASLAERLRAAQSDEESAWCPSYDVRVVRAAERKAGEEKA